MAATNFDEFRQRDTNTFQFQHQAILFCFDKAYESMFHVGQMT